MAAVNEVDLNKPSLDFIHFAQKQKKQKRPRLRKPDVSNESVASDGRSYKRGEAYSHACGANASALGGGLCLRGNKTSRHKKKKKKENPIRQRAIDPLPRSDSRNKWYSLTGAEKKSSTYTPWWTPPSGWKYGTAEVNSRQPRSADYARGYTVALTGKQQLKKHKACVIKYVRNSQHAFVFHSRGCRGCRHCTWSRAGGAPFVTDHTASPPQDKNSGGQKA